MTSKLLRMQTITDEAQAEATEMLVDIGEYDGLAGLKEFLRTMLRHDDELCRSLAILAKVGYMACRTELLRARELES